MAVFREEYEQALTFLAALETLTPNPSEHMETGGPSPLLEGWLISFYRGTLLLLMKRTQEAILDLERAQRIILTPEGANNLGVAMMQSGDIDAARELFRQGLAMYPEYRDAWLNLQGTSPPRASTHPLRVANARRDYAPFPSA
jgi:tetratricopeptide (TPR) repeat protein